MLWSNALHTQGLTVAVCVCQGATMHLQKLPTWHMHEQAIRPGQNQQC